MLCVLGIKARSNMHAAVTFTLAVWSLMYGDDMYRDYKLVSYYCPIYLIIDRGGRIGVAIGANSSLFKKFCITCLANFEGV